MIRNKTQKFKRWRFRKAVLKAFRREGITQAEFAKKLGVGTSNVSRYMSLEIEPNIQLLRRLCAAETWKNPNTGLEILEARLLDEVELAGRSLTDVKIELPGNKLVAREIEYLRQKMVDDFRDYLGDFQYTPEQQTKQISWNSNGKSLKP